VIGILRFVGLMNAAVWFGATVFFTIGAWPAFFSQEMRHLLGENNYPYFSEAIAQIVITSYAHLHLVCSIVALLHAAAEWLYLGRNLPKFGWGLLLTLFFCGLVTGYGLQPKIKELHTRKFARNYAPEVRKAAAESLPLWRGMAQTINIAMIAGLAVYVWRVAHPVTTAKFVAPIKFQS